MILDPTDEETEALARLLSRTIDDDHYPVSPRIQTLKAILGKIRPEPVREPPPPLKVKTIDEAAWEPRRVRLVGARQVLPGKAHEAEAPNGPLRLSTMAGWHRNMAKGMRRWRE